ncbi:MAG: glycerophosphodiester phosphodiesterase family protein [Gammaproteobacteria bacterium]|nr:glycerophosphodiester phosphodiesterase family protein [Gammaproteobacteria bacterium]
MNNYADKLVAHRGYPQHFPENTLAGIKAAMYAGARYIEVDIQLTADGIPVIFHDRDLQRLCQKAGRIHEYTWKQLSSFRVCNSINEQARSGPIPQLQQLVELISQHPAVTVFIELKRISLDHWGDNKVVTVILDCLQPVLKQCVIISYSRTALEKVRSASKQPVGFVCDDWEALKQHDLQTLKPEYVFCDLDTLPAQGPLNIPGSRLAVYECVEPQQAVNLFERGVDLIETFAIVKMRETLADYVG